MNPSEAVAKFTERHGDMIGNLAAAVSRPPEVMIINHAKALLAIEPGEMRCAERSIVAELRKANQIKEQL